MFRNKQPSVNLKSFFSEDIRIGCFANYKNFLIYSIYSSYTVCMSEFILNQYTKREYWYWFLLTVRFIIISERLLLFWASFFIPFKWHLTSLRKLVTWNFVTILTVKTQSSHWLSLSFRHAYFSDWTLVIHCLWFQKIHPSDTSKFLMWSTWLF